MDGEGLRVRGKHYILLNTIAQAPSDHRIESIKASFPPLLSFAPLSGSVSDWQLNFKTTVIKKMFYCVYHLLVNNEDKNATDSFHFSILH